MFQKKELPRSFQQVNAHDRFNPRASAVPSEAASANPQGNSGIGRDFNSGDSWDTERTEEAHRGHRVSHRTQVNEAKNWDRKSRIAEKCFGNLI
jgi:hypothetical protein